MTVRSSASSARTRPAAPVPDAADPFPIAAPQRAAAVLLAALSITTVVAADPAGLSPFGPLKWLAISTIGYAAVGWTFWSTRVDGDRTTGRIWCVLLALLTLAALTNGDVPTALLGHPSRHLGVLTWVLFALLFAAGQRLRRPADRRTVIRGIALAAAITGLWSTWELTIGRVIDIAVDTSRLTGPFGSAAMLGAAACLLAPVGLGLGADREERPAWRVVGAVGGLTSMLALVGSGTRGAWVAAAVAAAIAVVRVRPSRRALGIGALVVIASCVAVAPRLGDVTERSAGSASRLDEWRVAARVIGRHPIVGVGPEGYRIAVREGIDRDYERAYSREQILPDRAHSAPLDIALSGGVLAAAAWCLLVVILAGRCLQLLHRGASGVTAGLATGVLAYAGQQLVLFPLAELDPIWWLCAGLVVSITAEAVPNSRRRARRARRGRRGRRAVALAGLTIAPIALVGGVLDVAADRLARRSLEHLAGGRRDEAADDAERATSLRPDDVRYRLVAAHVHAEIATLADIRRGLGLTADALAWSPDDPYALDQWAGLLLQRAQVTRTPADVDAAVAAWQRLVAADPHRARWQRQLGRAAVLAGDVDLARRAWTLAVDLSPDDHTAARLLAGLPPEGTAP